MADLNANINVGIETTQALNQLKALQKQISQFHQSVAKSSSTAAVAQRDLQKNFLNSVNAIQGFSAELKTVRTTAESFTNSLEKNKFSIREYFRYAAGSTKTFGKNFAAEFSTIEKTAIERVKTLQTQYIKMGRDASGAMQAIAIRPTVLDMKDLGTQTAIAAQKSVIFNQLVKQGSTNLLNFGKNTQWAGRQLMVGFTLPLATLGMTAGRVFFDMEKAAIKFKKVYGDLFTAPEETAQAMESIMQLGEAYSAYGIAVSETLDIAADAAAAGFGGIDLQNQTSAALKLSVLGQLDLQKALETTISLQNAFQLSSADLAGEIDFLNAVENQTVVALEDITEAVPRVAPVIQALGGDVRDLAFFLAAMKEGGVNAAQGANALKSGLASLINPSEKAAAMLGSLGINIKGIISTNQGDLAGTVFAFAKSLDKLDPLRRAQAIEQLFGKFQFARISALFDNITREGTQAQRVLELAGSTAQELADLSESELGVSAASSMNKFRSAVERIKVALVPIGELLVEIATPFVEFGTKMLEAFNNLPDGVKKAIGSVITIVGGLGPVILMTFGLINNGIANMIKFFATVRLGYLKITGQAKGVGDETQYMTQEQLEAAAAAASLDQAHSGLVQRFTAEKVVVDRLRDAYTQAAAAGARFAALNPGMMLPGTAPQKFAQGGFVSGSGNGDTVPAMLTPGEFVIKKKEAQVFLPLLQAINEGKVPGFNNGGMVGKGFSNATMFLPESLNTLAGGSGPGAAMGDVTAYLKQAGSAAAAPLMAVMAREMGVKLNDPSLFKEWEGLGSTLIQSATTALEQSGKQFVTDDDFEEIVVPAMKKSAESISVSGKEVKKALENAFEQIRTVAPLGAKSGASGGQGRVSLPGSYRGARAPAQKFALASNPEMFQQSERFSQSRSRIVKSFQTKNVATGEFEVATMSHLKRSITAKVDELILKVAPYLGDQSARIVKAVSKSTVDGIKESTKQASPSKEAYNAGKNVGVGAVNGIKESIDDAKIAGEQLGEAATSGVRKVPRRASTNPEVMAALAGTSQAQINTGPRRASSPAGSTQNGVFVPVQQQVEQTKKATLSMAGFADKASKATFALSAVSGILTMFGGEMSAVTGVVMGISSAMFALIQVTSLLSSTKLGAIAAERASSIAQGIGGGFGKAGSLLGSGGFLTKIANAFKFILRFLGPVGIGLAALAIAVPFVVKLLEEQKQKIEGLGNVATLTADKIKKLGDIFGVRPQETAFEGTKPIVSGTSEAPTIDQRSLINQVRESEGFAEDFKSEIQAIKESGKEEAELALKALAIKLTGKGFAKEQVDAIVGALVTEAARTDVKLDMKSIDLNINSNRAILEAQLQAELKAIEDLYSSSTTKALAEPPESPWWLKGFELYGQNLVTSAQTYGAVIDQELKTKITSLSAVFQSLFIGLSGQLSSGQISVKEFNSQFDFLNQKILNMPKPEGLLLIESIVKNLPESVQELINGLENVGQQMIVIKAISAGLNIDSVLTEQEIADIQAGSKEGAGTKAIEKKDLALRKLTDATNKFATAVENASKPIELTPQEEIQMANDGLQEQITKLKDQAASFKALTDAGIPAAEAIKLLGNEALVAATKNGVLDGTTLELVKELIAAQSAVDSFSGGRGGGSNPIADSIEALKKQRAEIINTSKAYSTLRRSGMDAQKAMRFAQDPNLLSAMNAGLKAGTKQWDEIIKRIRAAEKAARRWQNATVEGRTEQFMETYNKVQDLFSAEEAALRSSFEIKTKADNDLIRSLEDKIEGFNREIQGYSRDLDDIAEKETVINEAYDKKVEALEKTKRINEDILRQQKSQLSIADALSQGDIAAAASAMQQARSENAAAAMQAQGDQLALAREAQISGVRSAGGLSRDQLEEKIRGLKKEISVIENGTLQTARDRVKAAQDELDRNINSLEVGRLSKAQWEEKKSAIDVAKARAVLYDKELKKALKKVEGIVAGWNSLNKTITTTQVINTVYTSSGKEDTGKTDTNTKKTTKASGGKLVQKIAGGGSVKYYPMGGLIPYMADGGMFQSVNTDTVPAMLTPGEFVVRRSAVDRFGLQNLKNINNGTYGNTLSRGFNKPVYPEISRSYPSENIGGGLYANNFASESPTQVDNSVYNNYNLSVNVEGTNASPEQIANVVIRKLQNVGSQRVRGQVVR
jgi:TP901 family phage tail tape measure protein